MLTSILLNLTLVGAEWVLWVLVILSFLSFALIVERCIYFYLHYEDPARLSARLLECLKSGDTRSAWNLVADSDNIECHVIAEGLRALKRGATSCGEAMLATKSRMRQSVDARLAILATIGSNAPFVGLLGTVLGIVKAAHDLSGGGKGDPNAVMSGVFEALVATAVGLIVAIPAVVAFNLLQRRVRTTMAQVDSLAHLVLSFARSEPRSVAAPQARAMAPVSSAKVS